MQVLVGRAAVAIFAVAMLVSGCTKAQDRDQATVRVQPGKTVTLEVPDGPTVTVPAGSVDRAGVLVAQLVSDPPDPAEGTTAGPVWDLHLEGATLTGAIQVTIPFEPDDEELVAGLSYWDEGAGAWSPVASEVDAAAGTVTASVDHLSWWKPWTWKLPDVKGWVSDQFAQAAGRPAVSKPTCDGADELRQQVTVTSDSGGNVKWCAGVENSTQVVRVTNARPYAVEVRRPDAWRAGKATPSMGVIDSAIGFVSNVLVPEPTVSVIGPGQSLELTAPPGTPGTVTVTPSGASYLVSAMALGFQTFAMVSAKVPGGPAAKASRAATVFAEAVDVTSCTDDIRGLFVDASLDSGSKAVAFFQDALGFSFGCMKSVWEKGYGLNGAVWVVVVAVVSWAIDAVATLVNGVRVLVDTLRDLNGYQVTVAPKPQTRATAPPATIPMGWVGQDEFFGLVRMTLHPDGGAQVDILGPGQVQFSSIGCTGPCDYAWSLDGDQLTVTGDQNNWTWTGKVTTTSWTGTGTFIRGMQHSFTYATTNASGQCPTSEQIQALDPGEPIDNLALSCFEGFAVAVYDVLFTGAEDWNTTLSIWQLADGAWQPVGDRCRTGTLPAWLEDGACNVN